MADEGATQVRLERSGSTRVFGRLLDDDLRKLFSDKAPDLVCLTGDVADWCLKTEYNEVLTLVRNVCRSVRIIRLHVPETFRKKLYGSLDQLQADLDA